MCGVIGYVGEKPCVRFIFDALKKLEYRGYDSAGISVCYEGQIHVEKEQGKLSNLEAHLDRLPQQAVVGMGHTRWATHGIPNKDNAHPHAAEGVILIHNGIIENYKELKDELIREGVKFKSQTDSEVVAQLLSRELKKGTAPKESLLKVTRRLKGAYALGIIMEKDPQALWVMKYGSPLVLGLGEGENFFGSDAMTFAGIAQRAVFMNDGECARLTKNSIEYFDADGKTLPLNPIQLNWNIAAVEKQGYRHFMLKEIHEQPSVVANTITRLVDRFNYSFNEQELGLKEISLDKVKRINIVACGTAYYAGMLGKYFIESLARIPVNVELASEFRYRKPYIDANDLCIAVSQSGETADTLASLTHAKSTGCQIFSVCNVRYSAIPRASQSTLYMEAGQEIGVASTKAFTSQVLCLYLWALAVAEKRGHATRAQVQEAIDQLQTLPVHMENAIVHKELIEELAHKYYEFPNFIYVGRGQMYPIALEGALKLKEISYIHAEGYAAGELKHGPIALIDRHMPIVAIAPRDEYYEKSFSNIQEIKAREGLVIGIGKPDDHELKELCRDFIPCPHIDNPAFQAILTTIPIQFLAYYVAVKRGTDVDQPRNLAKSVTVE